MQESPDHSQPADDPALPAGLVEALGGLHRHQVSVPASVDAAILRDAKAGFASRRRFWLARRAVGAAAAVAAAAVVVVVLFLDRNRHTPAPIAATGQALNGDLDGNGRVDILDALVLARKVDAKASPGAGDDVNGDGVVDRRDVDVIAARAVAVDAPESLGRS
jgi:hypothetical protein